MDVPTRGNRRQVGYLLVRAFVSFIGLGWHGWLTFSCRQILLALAVPFPPVSLGQGEAVSYLSPLSVAGPLPCFVPVLFAFRWTWPSVCSSSKCHVDAYISMFSQSVLFSERCVCSGYGHGWESRSGVRSPQLRDSSRERKRRPWRASSSPWNRARRHASDALSHRAFHTVLFFLFAAPYKNLT